MNPSKLQQNVIDAIQNTDHNIVVDAKAGSGKTTLLRMIANAIPATDSILILAFNKSIATELKQKDDLKGYNIDIRTCHSHGMRTILEVWGKGVKVDSAKMKKHYKVLNEQWDIPAEEKDRRKSILEAANLARLNLKSDVQGIRDMCFRYDIPLLLADTGKVLDLCKAVQDDNTCIDFTDMVFHPALRKSMQPRKYKWVLIDECQDLNVLQQKLMMKSLLPGGRFVAVGDPSQAIYGFAGADVDSFNRLKAHPNTVVMPLNECFRCGHEIIKLAQQYEPNIIAFHKNGKGEIQLEASYADPVQGDMVLCRNTLPLVKLCYSYIGNGKKAYIKGRDIGKSLIALTNRWKTNDLKVLSAKLEEYLSDTYKQLQKANPHLEPEDIYELGLYVKVKEQVNIINLLIARNGDVVDCETLRAKLEAIFKDDGEGICLSTIHKAKGLEADNVYVLERQLMPSPYAKRDWQKEQENNLIYVCYTRAKERLAFISDWTTKDS